jgi:hypothetical protein
VTDVTCGANCKTADTGSDSGAAVMFVAVQSVNELAEILTL